jgi:hypothetical protein
MADDDFEIRTITGQASCPACQHYQAGTFDASRHVHSCRRETPAERALRASVNARLADARRAHEQALEERYGR